MLGDGAPEGCGSGESSHGGTSVSASWFPSTLDGTVEKSSVTGGSFNSMGVLGSGQLS